MYGSGIIGRETYFGIFEELAAIPHASGDCGRICDWCEKFARDRGLRYQRDCCDNIVIFKDGTAGYETHEPIILQGHLDMVFERDAVADAPRACDPLRLEVDDDLLSAYHTTLGGDDGIAVAYALAILDAGDIAHPPIEVILTSDEEIGMLGASALDTSCIRGRRMINIDSEDEGVFLCGCAGGALVSAKIPFGTEIASGISVKIALSGFSGGHSGVEIHRGRRNACVELGKLMVMLSDEGVPFAVNEMEGGGKDNAIPRSATVRITVADELTGALERVARDFAANLKIACTDTDPDFCFEITVENRIEGVALSIADSALAGKLLARIPDGVLRRDPTLPAGIETSSNLGIMSLGESGELLLSFLVRSAKNIRKSEACDAIAEIVRDAGGSVEFSGDYPAWEYRANSPLRDIMTETYTELYGRAPTFEVIHAGLECGILGDKIGDLDCISIGPDMWDIHTTSERLSISSCRRVWNYLILLLPRL